MPYGRKSEPTRLSRDGRLHWQSVTIVQKYIVKVSDFEMLPAKLCHMPVSVCMSLPIWPAQAVFCSKIVGFVPKIQHANLRTVGQPE